MICADIIVLFFKGYGSRASDRGGWHMWEKSDFWRWQWVEVSMAVEPMGEWGGKPILIYVRLLNR